MSKYRIRLRNGRVIGPFELEQLLELAQLGRLDGKEEAQIYPTGEWLEIKQFDFYSSLKFPGTKNTELAVPKEETFVISLDKIKKSLVEKEVEVATEEAVFKKEPLTETIQLNPEPSQVEEKFSTAKQEDSLNSIFEQQLLQEIKVQPEPSISKQDRTQINPIAQKEIEEMRKRKIAEEKQLKAEEEERKRKEEEHKRIVAIRSIPESEQATQMLVLDKVKLELIKQAENEEVEIKKEAKKVKKELEKKKREEEPEEDDEELEIEENKKKKKKIIILIAVGALLYAMLFPDQDKPQKPPFVHFKPEIEFPVPFDKADVQRSKIEYEKALGLLKKGDYPSTIKAGKLLKSSYENDIDNHEVLSLLVRSYAEQLRFSMKDKQADAHIVFNLIQAKRPFLAKIPNGVIGLNLFYSAINKHEAAADVISKYLKLYPKNVTQDLFAMYLKTLLKLGKLDLAKQFLQALLKAPDKNQHTLDALAEFSFLNQESDKAIEYLKEANSKYPQLVMFHLALAEHLLKNKNIKSAEELLTKAEELNLENNDIYRAKYLYLKGIIHAYKGEHQAATAKFKKSLELEDSSELRMKLAQLDTSGSPSSDTDKLIAESKSISLLNQAKDFFDKRNYELAMSSAAKATDALPGYIPAELYLAKTQLKLGLARQALKTLEELIKKYPDDKSINLALVDAYIDTFKFNDAKNRIGIISSTELKNSFEFASINGRLYNQMSDSLQAISWFRNSINMNPLNDEDIYLLAQLLIKRSNFDAARTLLNKCIELDPTNPDYRIAYAKIVYEQQDDLAAVGYLLGLINEFGENPKIMAEIAIFYYRAGKIKDFQAYKEKLEKLPAKDKSLYEFLIKAALLDERFNEIPGLVEQLLRIEPGELDAMMTAGRVLFENAKFSDAAIWFKRLQQKLETYPKVQYYIAKIKFMDKDYDGALKEVEADLKANGDNDADLTLMAQIYAEKGDLIQAENLFKRSQKINPKAYESLMGLADISTKRNNFDLALDLYKKALMQKGDEPVIHKKIGDVYRLLGQGALAVESYKLYLEMAPEAADKSQIQSYINLMQ